MYLYYLYRYVEYKAVAVKSRLKIRVWPKEHQCPTDRQYTVPLAIFMSGSYIIFKGFLLYIC
jgi:hypothetical protein